MAYTPYYPGGWQSGESGGTPITPAALNNIEDGIGAASNTLFDYTTYDGNDAGTVENGATLETNASYTRCIKKAGYVCLKVRLHVPTISTAIDIFALNTALVPPVDISYVHAHNEWDDSIWGSMSISTLGHIRALQNCSGKDLTLYVTYPAKTV